MIDKTRELRLDVTEGQKDNLANWLRERELADMLAEGEDDEIAAGLKAEEILHTEPGRGAVVELRQIRLMYPDCRATWSRPFYVAILGEPAPGVLLVAPFSRFEYPALPGEWITGREESQLRVLCLWNSFSIKRRRLHASWEVDRLTPAQMETALAILAALEGRGRFPSEMIDRVGPTVLNPADPRWDYREEELELVESIMPLADSDGTGTGYRMNEQPIQYRSKAAEKHDPGDGD